MDPTREEVERAVSSSSEALIVCDPEGRIVGANDEVRSLTGFAREDLLSRSLGDLTAPGDAPPTHALLPALGGHARVDLDTDVRCKDGSTSRLHLTVCPLPLGGGGHTLVRLARGRRAADRLTRDPQFVRALLQTPGTLLLSICSDGKVCLASVGFQALTGLDFREIRGRPVWEFLADPAERNALREAVATPGPGRTVVLTWPSGSGGSVRTLWTPTRIGGVPPLPPYVLLIGQEIPPPRKSTRRSGPDPEGRRNLERRIEELTAQLEEAQSERDALTYTIAHDLRAPLRAMTGFSDTLVEEYAGRSLDETGTNYAQRIAESAQRMDTLIEDLLIYSRLGRSPVFLEPVSLPQAVGEVVAHLERGIRAAGADVRVEVAPVAVVADRGMLYLVLSHLLTNALKFHAPGAVARVRARARQEGDRVRLEIEDEGIGIAPEYLDRIFGVFQRLNRTEVYAGTGMGLAIVKRAMDRMAGTVGVESWPQKGSRFWIELHASDPPNGDRPTEGGAPRGPDRS